MADTFGLMKTRNEWMQAVENGETNLTHSEWYKKKQLDEQAKSKQEEQPSLASLAME